MHVALLTNSHCFYRPSDLNIDLACKPQICVYSSRFLQTKALLFISASRDILFNTVVKKGLCTQVIIADEGRANFLLSFPPG